MCCQARVQHGPPRPHLRQVLRPSALLEGRGITVAECAEPGQSSPTAPPSGPPKSGVAAGPSAFPHGLYTLAAARRNSPTALGECTTIAPDTALVPLAPVQLQGPYTLAAAGRNNPTVLLWDQRRSPLAVAEISTPGRSPLQVRGPCMGWGWPGPRPKSVCDLGPCVTQSVFDLGLCVPGPCVTQVCV